MIKSFINFGPNENIRLSMGIIGQSRAYKMKKDSMANSAGCTTFFLH